MRMLVANANRKTTTITTTTACAKTIITTSSATTTTTTITATKTIAIFNWFFCSPALQKTNAEQRAGHQAPRPVA